MAITAVSGTIMPASGDPATAATRNRPITRRPDVTGCGTSGSHHDCRRRHHHRQRETDREAEEDSGIGRQGSRANQGGGKKHLRFHKVHFSVDLVVQSGGGLCRLPSQTITVRIGESCRVSGRTLTKAGGQFPNAVVAGIRHQNVSRNIDRDAAGIIPSSAIPGWRG